MNEAWTWRPLGEMFEIGAGKTLWSGSGLSFPKRQWFQLIFIMVIQGLRGLA